jgi:hypothetical protein
VPVTIQSKESNANKGATHFPSNFPNEAFERIALSSVTFSRLAPVKDQSRQKVNRGPSCIDSVIT